MKIYLPNIAGAPALHTSFVTPAADKEFIKGEITSEWLEPDGKPVLFEVKFRYGEAEVPDSVGKYMVARELARVSKLILPGDLSNAKHHQ